jgi:transposase
MNCIIGIDVSKDKIDVAWLRDIHTLKVKTKVFKNTPSGYAQLCLWLSDNTKQPLNQCHCTLEATGIYHEPLSHWLFEQGISVSVCNPAQVKSFAKSLGSQHKTDKIDSIILARYGALMKPQLWQPEPKAVRELKALIARLEAIESDLLREQNRMEKAEFSAASELVIESLNTMIQHLESERKRLDQEIDDHIDRHPDLKRDQELLQSIPSVGRVVSRLMLSVIRGKDFKTAGDCAAFIGLIPKIQESGVFKGRASLSKKGNSRIRAKLYLPAVTAMRYNPSIEQHTKRLLEKGKNKMQAVGAAMRKLVHICFGVLKNQMPYEFRTAA